MGGSGCEGESRGKKGQNGERFTANEDVSAILKPKLTSRKLQQLSEAAPSSLLQSSLLPSYCPCPHFTPPRLPLQSFYKYPGVRHDGD